MATNTPNCGLIKPDQDEFYTIDDFNTNVDIIDEQMADKTDKSEVDGIQSEIEQDKGKIDLHIGTAVNSEEGVHNIRYHKEKLEFNDGAEWVEIYTGGKGLYPGDVTDKDITIGNAKVTIKWGDPNDVIVDGQTACKWAGTKLVYKAGSYPLHPNDGIMVMDNKVRNEYKTNGFTIEGLANFTTYYFALFPYSDKGAVNLNTTNRLTGTPNNYRVMTVIIDNTNSNPDTRCTYADDAAGLSPESKEFDKFFGYYPCLLKNKVEVGKLNPNNYAQFEDGTPADITSGNAGDVMIRYPARGYKWVAATDKDVISITDEPGVSGFSYNAFYFGVYPTGRLQTGDIARSVCSAKSQITGSQSWYKNEFLPQGYSYKIWSCWGYWTTMYIIYFKSTFPRKKVDPIINPETDYRIGGGNTAGYFHQPTGKLFGIELATNIYGEHTQDITSGFIQGRGPVVGSDYDIESGRGLRNAVGGYYCFLPKRHTLEGSETTYWCNYIDTNSSNLQVTNGPCGTGGRQGVFDLLPETAKCIARLTCHK